MSDTTAAAPFAIVGVLERLLRAEAVPGLVSAYVFGSHAAGRSHRESDVDLGVLLDRRLHPSAEARFRERVRLSAWVVGALHQNAVDVVVLNDAPPQLERRIVTSGCRVFCLDPETDHAFVRDVQLRAADLQPFLDRTRRIKLDALARFVTDIDEFFKHVDVRTEMFGEEPPTSTTVEVRRLAHPDLLVEMNAVAVVD